VLIGNVSESRIASPNEILEAGAPRLAAMIEERRRLSRPTQCK
jgi:hypothetical protein